MDAMQVLQVIVLASRVVHGFCPDWIRIWGRRGAYNRPTAKIAKTPILRLVGILSFEMR